MRKEINNELYRKISRHVMDAIEDKTNNGNNEQIAQGKLWNKHAIGWSPQTANLPNVPYINLVLAVTEAVYMRLLADGYDVEKVTPPKRISIPNADEEIHDLCGEWKSALPHINCVNDVTDIVTLAYENAKKAILHHTRKLNTRPSGGNRGFP